MCREICITLGVPLTPSLVSNLCQFYDQKLKKLEFLNEQMIYAYSSALIYRNCRNLKKEVFAKGMKKEIFSRALQEVDDWDKAQETVETGEGLVCNLYSIVG